MSVAGAALIAFALAFPTHLDVGEPTYLRSMLTSMSLHGLPSMAVGFLVNGFILSCMTVEARRLLRGS